MRDTDPSMPSVRLAAMVVFMTSSGWPKVVTSNMFRPAPSSRLENLTGFFSSAAGLGRPTPGLPVTLAVDMAGGWGACFWRK